MMSFSRSTGSDKYFELWGQSSFHYTRPFPSLLHSEIDKLSVTWGRTESLSITLSKLVEGLFTLIILSTQVIN